MFIVEFRTRSKSDCDYPSNLVYVDTDKALSDTEAAAYVEATEGDNIEVLRVVVDDRDTHRYR